MKDKRKHVIFNLAHIRKLGEAIEQVWYLRNLFYDKNKYRITIFSYPYEIPDSWRVNKAFFNIIFRGLDVINSRDDDFLFFSKYNRKPYYIVDKDRIYISSCDLVYFKQNFMLKYQNIKPPFYFSLSDYEYKRGEKIRNAFGIPKNAPIVTLHVRESGFDLIKCSTTPYLYTVRDSNIENYVPAINHLIKKGFYVVKIGDKSMKKILNSPPQLIDAPSHPDYTDLVDPYFIVTSKFYFGSAAGPSTFAEATGVPILYVNARITPNIWTWGKDLYLFKKYYSHHLKRQLSFEEILLSPAIYLLNYSLFTAAGIELIENSAQEILIAVKEMLSRLDGTYPSMQDNINFNRHFKLIQAKSYYFQKQLNPMFPYVPMYHFFDKNDFFPISIECLKQNPEFLGHNWTAMQVNGKEISDLQELSC